MLCLTVKQPWAWGLIHGPKRIENRSRQTYHRGPLAIHAGASRSEMHPTILNLFPDLDPDEQIVYGSIIGILEVVECRPIESVLKEPFAEGPWCWVTANPRPVKPVAWRGNLGLFNVPDDVLIPIR